MLEIWTPWIGLIAALLTTSSFIPQALKTIKTRSARDFSWPYLLLFGISVSLWALYGLLRNDGVIIGANLVTLLLILVIGAVKARHI
ncbi:SemiSWEET transporter [Leptolyngbya sp. FACHB-261]|nr:SemiSWEET transporter [Leptolyngbya sp. FACHB-261]